MPFIKLATRDFFDKDLKANQLPGGIIKTSL